MHGRYRCQEGAWYGWTGVQCTATVLCTISDCWVQRVWGGGMVHFGGCTIVQMYYVLQYGFWVQGGGGGGGVQFEKCTPVQCTVP